MGNRRTWTQTLIKLIGGISLACVGIFAFAHFAAEPDEPKQVEVKSRAGVITAATLGGPERFLTYLSTDKPLYKPGETVYVRGVVLNHRTHQPLSNNQIGATVEVLGPKGDVVAGGTSLVQDAVLGFKWEVPPSMAGGEYTLKTTWPALGYTPAERKFDIRAYRAPRLKSQIKFVRDGYGPGDEVVAQLETTRAEGGVPAGAAVTITARVDGDEVFRGKTTVDSTGNAVARFPLPADIRRGEGTLALIIEDGGIVETASKTIPILLQTVDLKFFPEGGNIVAGVPNRVYFEGRTPAKKPADIAGVVVDKSGEEVAQFKSEHDGRGRFNFTPVANGTYSLKINQPSGIDNLFPLPEVQADGVTLRASKDVFAAGEPIKLTVSSASPAEGLEVTLMQRETELASKPVKFAEGKKQVEIVLPADDVDGVLIATVWDKNNKPLAERLVFRQPENAIQVEIKADAKQYVPGGKAKVTVKTVDETGKPVSAVVGVNVVDDSVLEMVDKRDQRPDFPTMVLLENEVSDLADAHVYLSSDDESAPVALDLLLGTQGWRRFALVNSGDFLEEHGDEARRMLALRLNTYREERKMMALAEALPDIQKAAMPRPARPGEAFDDFADEAEMALEAPAEEAANELEAAPQPVVEAVRNEAAPPKLPARDEDAFVDDLAELEVEEQALGDFEEEQGIAAEANARPAPAMDAKRQALAQRLDRAQRQEDALIIGGAMGNREKQRNDMVNVRVFAHQVRKDRQAGDRIDFSETLYFAAGIKTDEEGTADIEFGLNDSVTSFRVEVSAFDSRGALGSASELIESVKPFYLEPKLPLEVSQGDFVRVPIGIVNATDAPLDATMLNVTGHASQEINAKTSPFVLGADERVRRLMAINVGKFHGEASLTVAGTAGPYGDKVTRTMQVRPAGFPIEAGFGGLLSPGATATHEFEVPADVVDGSLSAKIVVYPTPLASMEEALARLIREPHGCFEQTSSTTYPLVMAQQYFMSHQGVDPEKIEKSSQILETGYNRLIGFESPSGGFEWFGGDPGHDALSAYGLMQFTDMKEVRFVDPAMLERTKNWLVDQRDGKGGYKRATHTLHTWLPQPELSTTYNTWGLLSAGVEADLKTEVAAIRELAETTENTYVMAMAANVFIAAGDKDGRNQMLDKLAGKQQDDGSLKGATQSVVGSGGEALQIETTALATLAWLQDSDYAANVEKSVKYLAEVCEGGRFGSTQSTVLALKAIVAYDKSRARPQAAGSLQLLVDGKEFGGPVKFDTEQTGPIQLPDCAELLTGGEHTVAVRMEGGSQMPYSMTLDYSSLKPNSSDDCKVHLEVTLADAKIDEGASTDVRAVVINRTGETIPTPMAIVGLPGGLEPRFDQLKELVAAETISAFEVRGREVILYWRALEPEARVEVPISVIAAIPGTYSGPASRGYLYYTDEDKIWVDPLKVEIAPK